MSSSDAKTEKAPSTQGRRISKKTAVATKEKETDSARLNVTSQDSAPHTEEAQSTAPQQKAKSAPRKTGTPKRPGRQETLPPSQRETLPPSAPIAANEGTAQTALPSEHAPKADVDLSEHRELAVTLAAQTGFPPASTESPLSEESARRKNRRGRRGGRGKKRKTDLLMESADSQDTALSQPQVTQGSDEVASVSFGNEKLEAEPAKHVRQKMFISIEPGEQVEVAIAQEGIVHEYYLEMTHHVKIKGNIYKGIIHNIDTNLQAAFINYGAEKNGFLQIDEIHPEYFLTHHESAKGKKYPPIQKVLKPGQEILVQVVKEPNGSKGAFLTTWLSLAGRFLVLTPGQEQIGVSRKVESDEERQRLREMMNGIEPGEGLGVIVRTVSAGTSKTTLKADLQYLKRVWKEIRKKATAETAPSLIYQEPGLAERAVRDYLTEDVCEVWVDDAATAESLRETVGLVFPRKTSLVKAYSDVQQSLWERFNLQRQLEQIYSREVTLPSGGRLVFDQTEALMAIDINSGKISGKANFEAMAYKTNIEAAETIARQLKLRDVGGQIVVDFIEMRERSHIRNVEKTLRTAMKNDRARHDVSRMSDFGLLELVRQRTGSSALAITMETCPACNGTGLRRNLEWQALQALRDIRRLLSNHHECICTYHASTPELGMYLLNHKRYCLQEMEKTHNKHLEILIRPTPEKTCR